MSWTDATEISRGDHAIRALRSKHVKRGSTDVNDFLLLDGFSIAFIFTGSAEMALQECIRNELQAGQFDAMLPQMRSGMDFIRVLKEVHISADLSEWLQLVCERSAKDPQSLLDSWKTRASRSLAKVEDATSLVVAFSSLLPVVLASLLLITGYGNSLLVFSIVFITIAAFWVVSRWMRRLVTPLT